MQQRKITMRFPPLSRIIIERKVSHYVITYYIPSGLFVVVSWASFLIPCDDIQVIYHLDPVAVAAALEL